MLACHWLCIQKFFPVPLSWFKPFLIQPPRGERKPGLEIDDEGGSYSSRLRLQNPWSSTVRWDQVPQQLLPLLSHPQILEDVQQKYAIAFPYENSLGVGAKGDK